MKKSIILLGLFLSLQVLAQSEPLEPKWKSNIRSFVTSVVGEKWTERIMGAKPLPPAAAITLPEIPKDFKKSTSVESYTKLKIEPTAFDKLPNERKRHFDFVFLKELFNVTRMSEAKDEDLSNWMNVLDQGGSREGIYQALVLDEVYATLENMEEAPGKKLIDYSRAYAQKFLKLAYKEESLKTLNLYSIKRILTEKGLDLMEYWETKDLDALYRWYAIFSADLARDHATWMKSELRQNPSVDVHLAWAKSMPIQHIKSEYIIKLHTLMNGLTLLK